MGHHEGGKHAQGHRQVVKRYPVSFIEGNHGKKQYYKRSCDAKKHQLGIASGH
jgi:hypothetical protein